MTVTVSEKNLAHMEKSVRKDHFAVSMHELRHSISSPELQNRILPLQNPGEGNTWQCNSRTVTSAKPT